MQKGGDTESTCDRIVPDLTIHDRQLSEDSCKASFFSFKNESETILIPNPMNITLDNPYRMWRL